MHARHFSRRSFQSLVPPLVSRSSFQLIRSLFYSLSFSRSPSHSVPFVESSPSSFHAHCFLAAENSPRRTVEWSGDWRSIIDYYNRKRMQHTRCGASATGDFGRATNSTPDILFLSFFLFFFCEQVAVLSAKFPLSAVSFLFFFFARREENATSVPVRRKEASNSLKSFGTLGVTVVAESLRCVVSPHLVHY